MYYSIFIKIYGSLMEVIVLLYNNILLSFSKQGINLVLVTKFYIRTTNAIARYYFFLYLTFSIPRSDRFREKSLWRRCSFPSTIPLGI